MTDRSTLDVCHLGDCRAILPEIAAAGVRARTVVTSPPYWGLRDYQVDGQLGLEPRLDCLGWATGEPCGECYVCHLVEVFRAVWDVLADDGTVWLNLGDAYNTRNSGDANGIGKNYGRRIDTPGHDRPCRQATAIKREPVAGLKPKDLMGNPWRIAFALQADGWLLRQDIIWHKPQPMPESVRDRCTKAHESLFLLAKQPRYYYDAEAIREPAGDNTHSRGGRDVPASWNDQSFVNHGDPGERTARNNDRKAGGVPTGWDTGKGGHGSYHRGGRGEKEYNEGYLPDGKRNKRSVWTIPTQPYPGAHFATFPERLVEPCILAGSEPGDVVLDPFIGSGTVAAVAKRLGRRWLGVELSESYIDLQRDRVPDQEAMPI